MGAFSLEVANVAQPAAPMAPCARKVARSPKVSVPHCVVRCETEERPSMNQGWLSEGGRKARPSIFTAHKTQLPSALSTPSHHHTTSWDRTWSSALLSAQQQRSRALSTRNTCGGPPWPEQPWSNVFPLSCLASMQPGFNAQLKVLYTQASQLLSNFSAICYKANFVLR